VRQCAAVRQRAAVHAAVCGNARGSVQHCERQCATVLQCGSLRQCAAVHTGLFGRVRSSVCLLMCNYIMGVGNCYW
jgi:hypothetical protein